MSLGRCSDCGTVGPLMSKGICRGCDERRAEEFRTVKDYFRRHAGTPAGQVADETGVPLEHILGWVAEGRLTAAAGVAATDLGGDTAEAERLAAIRQQFAQTLRPAPAPASSPSAPDRSYTGMRARSPR